MVVVLIGRRGIQSGWTQPIEAKYGGSQLTHAISIAPESRRALRLGPSRLPGRPGPGREPAAFPRPAAASAAFLRRAAGTAPVRAPARGSLSSSRTVTRRLKR